MDKIGFLPYYSYSVSSCGKSNAVMQNSYSVDKQAGNTRNNEYMTSQASSASRAYGLSFINHNKTIPQMSLNNMVKWLESQGKVLGEDFNIDSSYSFGNTVLTLNNKQGQNELSVHYDNGNHDTWNCYEVIEYKNGKRTSEISRDRNNNLFYKTNYIDNKTALAEGIVDENLKCDTTPQEYEKYLKENNINYDIEYAGEEDNNRSAYINIYDDNKHLTERLWFYYGTNNFDEECQGLSKDNVNEKGERYRRIDFSSDSIAITTYLQ